MAIQIHPRQRRTGLAASIALALCAILCGCTSEQDQASTEEPGSTSTGAGTGGSAGLGATSSGSAGAAGAAGAAGGDGGSAGQDVLDVEQTNWNESDHVDVIAHRWVAQTFVPNITGRLTRVGLGIHREGDPGL